jgi:hypothetical protein
MEELMGVIGIKNFTFVAPSTERLKIVDSNQDHYLRRPGLEKHASLIATNIEILRNEGGHNAFLVFEDDVNIVGDLTTFNFEELPLDWSFIQLNYCAERCIRHQRHATSAHVVSSDGAACTGAMLYSKQGARKLLSAFTKTEGKLQGVHGGIDRWIRAARVGGGYIHQPMLFRQDTWAFGSGRLRTLYQHTVNS